TAFFDIDPLHRGLLRLETSGATQLAVFSPESSRQQFALGQTSARRTLPVFIQEGIWHIWTGYDHILFLLALMLPAALNRRPGGPRQGRLMPAFRSGTWEPQLAIRPVLSDVLKTVSAFTLAH